MIELKWNKYTRKGISEMRNIEGAEIGNPDKLIAQGVSISQADLDNGSPKAYDMIARNPNNHEDKWLVAEDYFDTNFVKVKG